MKTANDGKIFPRHLQLPLGFTKTEPGDLRRVMAFLDDSFSAEPPVRLSKVFCRFSEQPDAWPGARIARIISSLISDRMISCVVDGNACLQHHIDVLLEDPDQWERVQIIPRKRLQSCELGAIIDTCQNIFCMECPLDQDDLTHFLVGFLKQWKLSLAAFGRLAETGQYPGAADIRFCLSFIQGWLAMPDPYERICVVRNGKAALESFYHSFVRLKDFYEYGVGRWESWRKSLEKFTAYQSEIEDDPEAFTCLLRLRRVLEMQSPWDDFDCMDDLIARIKPIYDRIRDEKYSLLEHDTLLQINRMIETISGMLENVHARDEIRNMALVELQKIKKAIALDKPCGLISRQREMAEEAYEKSQDIVFSRS
jgi:hypothetical protein